MLKVLASGQSNMSGRGTNGPLFSTCDSRVTVWNNTNELGANGSAFVAPPAETNAPWDSSGGNNLALWFCDRAAKELQETVKLVLVAVGATAISGWHPTSPGAVYSEIDAVMTASSLGAADVFLWHQGESDVGSEGSYAAAFATFIAALRSDGFLGASAPVIIGGLDSDSSYDTMNTTLAGIADDETTYFTSLEDLPSSTPHFTGPALHTIGQRYWAEYRKHIGFPRVNAPGGLSSLGF